jgi:ubiquinone/menaquinone biosynthesis C-methylase UbiE
MSELLWAAGRRFARMTTRAVVARPRVWRLFRGPLRRQFDRLATGWEARLGPEALIPLDAALDRLTEPPRRVLDLGTGTGKAARVVARRFPQAEVVGVDLSPAMIGEARKVLPAELSGRVRFEVADASRLPFEEEAFDLVVLLNMIPFFEELARVTAPRGRVIVASSFGPQTPIYVSSETLREHLAPLGFGDFEELTAGEGIAFLATRTALV